jgi:hypothetical protein
MMLRPLALPYEHGAWGFLLEPIAVGLLVAPSRAGALVALGALFAFLARHPARLAVRDLFVTRKTVPRTRVCVLLTLGYGSVAITAFCFVGLTPLIPLAVAMPIAILQFAFDVRNQGRELTAELAGAVAAGWAACAIALAASMPAGFAVALWALISARAVTSVLYVRTSLRGESRPVMLAMHGAAIAVAVTFAWLGFVSILAVAAMGILFARALPGTGTLRARDIGMREFGYGTLTVLLVSLSV